MRIKRKTNAELRRAAFRRWAIALFLPLLIPAPGLSQHTTVITFDETNLQQKDTDGIGVRYANHGVVFQHEPHIYDLPLADLSCSSQARSGTKVLASAYLGLEFDPEPLIMLFPFGVSQVTVFVGNPAYPHAEPNLVMNAYDQEVGGNRVSTASASLPLGCSNFQRRMGVAEPNNQPIIRRVELKGMDPSIFEFIDDLTIESESEPPPTAHEPPKVTIAAQILTPTPGNPAIALVTGKITGEGLFVSYVPPKLVHQWPVDQNSTDASSSKENLVQGISLFGSPPTLTFSIKKELSNLGTNTFIVYAYNAAGTGSAKASVDYLPDCVQKKLGTNPQQFGGFRYGGGDPGVCQTAVFQSGAIFCTPVGTFTSTGAIFTKWEADAPGCAIGDEQPVQMDTCAVINGARFQDFTNARIYHSQTTGTHSVPEPFRTAIDKLDFTREFGLPITEVIEQKKPLLPRKWQKFKGRCDAMWFFSSMEITAAAPAQPGSPAEPDQLWVATPDLSGLRRAQVGSPSGRTPTVWQSFPCSSSDGPCNMTLPPQTPPKPRAGHVKIWWTFAKAVVITC